MGDYLLEEWIAGDGDTDVWLAGQQSTRRSVVLVELKPTSFDLRETFLADVRAKASAAHPLIASVYEAVSEPGHCFAVLERLPRESLADHLSDGRTLEAWQLSHILRRIAEASLALETSGTATFPLRAADIFLDPLGVVRLANVACAGQRESERSAGDIASLGQELAPLVSPDQSGSSRMLTLLGWMRGDGLERPLTWSEVFDYADQIEQQLVQPPTEPPPPVKAGKWHLPQIFSIAAVGLLAIAGIILFQRKGAPEPAPAIAVPEGNYPLPHGGTSSLPAFKLAAHEVTIGDYEKFLREISRLTAEERSAFNHPDQPAEKQSHEPGEWAEMLAAIKSGSLWMGRLIRRDCPVVNVDWWDAHAYSSWKGTSLPTEEQWFAATHLGLFDPSSLRPAGWGSVWEIPSFDRTPAGLVGMAGSVAEWTASRSLNPANPLGEKNWVIIGGSHLRPSSGVTAREWTTDRSTRRPDLGFRVLE